MARMNCSPNVIPPPVVLTDNGIAARAAGGSPAWSSASWAAVIASRLARDSRRFAVTGNCAVPAILQRQPDTSNSPTGAAPSSPAMSRRHVVVKSCPSGVTAARPASGLEGRKEKGAVVTVVDLRDPDGAACIEAVEVLVQGRACVGAQGVGVEAGVGVAPADGSMIFIGA